MINKKVLIVTLCKSPNAGAYLQAFALMKELERRHLEPYFLDIYDFKNNVKRFKFMFTRGGKLFKNLSFNLKKFVAYQKAEDLLPVVKRSSNIIFSAAFVGADEIWCVTNGSFNVAPEFFGINIQAKITFTYAASAGNATFTDVAKYPAYISGIQSFDLLSSRDEETTKIAAEAAPGANITRVLDPTFLVDFSQYEEPILTPERYIAVYTYGMSEEIVLEIKNYAKKHNLKLVSPGIKHSWCDFSIPCTPLQFLTIIKNAQCVITDTFHGTVFAIKYRKSFVSFGTKKKKIIDILKLLKLEQNLFTEGQLASLQIINTNYYHVDDILNQNILDSKVYIDKCQQIIETDTENQNLDKST